MKRKLRSLHVIQLLHFTFIILHFTFQKLTTNHTITFLLIILPFFSFSQNKITHLLEGGALAGAEIARNTGDFKYAPNIRYTFLYQATSRLQVGGGVAYEQFSRETLLPVYADAHIYTRETVNSPFFAMQAGYAIGWHKNYQQLEQYRYNGDLMLNIDYGRRLALPDSYRDNLAFHISAGLHFQTTRIQVDLDYSDDYVERINYVLVALKTGIAF